jgi:hypothetical protein
MQGGARMPALRASTLAGQRRVEPACPGHDGDEWVEPAHSHGGGCGLLRPGRRAGVDDLGSGRIVASEKKIPNLWLNLV